MTRSTSPRIPLRRFVRWIAAARVAAARVVAARVVAARVVAARVVAARVVAASVAAAVALASGCYEPESERLKCDDVLPAGTYSFLQINVLVHDNDKGCLSDGCHRGDTQQHGIRLDDPDLAYDEMSHSPEKFYALLASGTMPADGGTPWDADDLKLFRSWYCNGAFPP